MRMIDAHEFSEWIAYYKIEPFGDDWLQAGTIAATSANVWSKKQIKPEQFVPNYKSKKSPDELKAVLMNFAKMHNARIEREELKRNSRV